MLQAIFLAYFLRTELLKTTRMARTIHIDMVGDQLSIVLVGRSHIHLKTLFFCLMGHSTYHVICLIPRHFQHRDIHRLKNLLDTWYSPTYVLRRLLTLRLVLLKRFVTKSRTRRVESHSYMTGLEALDKVLKRDHKTEDRRGILAARIHTWRTDKGVIGAIDHRISIYEEEGFQGGKGFKGYKSYKGCKITTLSEIVRAAGDRHWLGKNVHSR